MSGFKLVAYKKNTAIISNKLRHHNILSCICINVCVKWSLWMCKSTANLQFLHGGDALLYLGSLSHLADVSGQRTLQFTATNHFGVPSFKAINHRWLSFTFSSCDRRDLESMPDNVVSALSINSFQHLLKTFISFSDPSAVSTSVEFKVVLIT